jgi:hypothetical protein
MIPTSEFGRDACEFTAFGNNTRDMDMILYEEFEHLFPVEFKLERNASLNAT